MRVVSWMLASSVGAAGILRVVLDSASWLDIGLGFAGPFTAAAVSWRMMARQYRSSPEGLTGVMIRAFAAKMLFIGAYVAVVLISSWSRPIPFVVTFTSFFLLLHILEAIGLHKLQAAGLRSSEST